MTRPSQEELRAETAELAHQLDWLLRGVLDLAITAAKRHGAEQ